MRLKQILLSLLAITLFANCTKNSSLEGNLEGDQSFAGVSIKFPKMVSKAVTEDPNATAEEQAVTTLGVYVVGTGKLGGLHSKIYGVDDFQEDPNGGNFYVLNTALKTTTGPKDVYVVINPTQNLIDQINAFGTTVFTDNGLELPYTDFFAASGNMVMSNTVVAKEVLEVQTPEQALANPTPVTVQRNLGKVAVLSKNESNGTFTTNAGHTISGLSFAPITRAKNSYLVQKTDATITDEVKKVITPGSAITPEKDNIYWDNTIAPATTDYKNVGVMVATAADKDPKSYAAYYALENVNVKNMVGNTTASIIKANVKLKDNTVVIGYNETTKKRSLGTLATGTSFYILKYDNSIWSSDARDVAVATDDFVAENFSTIYQDGVCYYRIWIKDANDVVGVVRNNYYIMQINSISGIGAPVPPGTEDPDVDVDPQPQDPIDEDTYISVAVEVLAWTLQESGHDL